MKDFKLYRPKATPDGWIKLHHYEYGDEFNKNRFTPTTPQNVFAQIVLYRWLCRNKDNKINILATDITQALFPSGEVSKVRLGRLLQAVVPYNPRHGGRWRFPTLYDPLFGLEHMMRHWLTLDETQVRLPMIVRDPIVDSDTYIQALNDLLVVGQPNEIVDRLYPGWWPLRKGGKTPHPNKDWIFT